MAAVLSEARGRTQSNPPRRHRRGHRGRAIDCAAVTARLAAEARRRLRIMVEGAAGRFALC